MESIRAALAGLAGQSFATLGQLRPPQLVALLDLGGRLKAEPGRFGGALAGRNLALLFEKHSTRTRVSFEVGIRQLGGGAVFLSRNEVQLDRGEPIGDTARVLGRYVDGIVLRTFAQDRFDAMAAYAGVPVINALTDRFHPCQILADLMTVRAHKGDLRGRVLAWVGDGNNVAHSMMLGCALAGLRYRSATPEGFEPEPEVVARARSIARETGASIDLLRSPVEAAAGADVVVTDVFASMGQEEEAAKRLGAFSGYRVDAALMARAHPDAIFLHCLPAHRGEEVSEEVIEGPRSVVWEEAENRLHAQKALLLALHDATEGV